MKKFAALIAVAVMASSPAVVPAQSAKFGPDQKTWDAVAQKAAKFLQSTQDKNGGWSTDKTPGVTGIALTGLLKSRQATPQDPVSQKALKYIESLVNRRKEAHRRQGREGPVAKLRHQHQRDGPRRGQARATSTRRSSATRSRFSKSCSGTKTKARTPSSDFFGGAGYDSKSRPDLSNTQMFLDALKAAGVGPDDPAMKKALIFVSRCQNIKGETNDRPWAKLINDGSFIYTAATGGVTKVVDQAAEQRHPARLRQHDLRRHQEHDLLRRLQGRPARQEGLRMDPEANYTVDKNPGMPEVRSQWGLYYYYHTMAKCLDALGIDYVVDAKGVKHDWRKDITEALAKRQRPDGSLRAT